jgi:hypothetical protein
MNEEISMTGFKYGPYDIFPAGQQLTNQDGSVGKWMALACVVRWQSDNVVAIPVSWYPPAFDTEHAAATHAAHSAKEMIDAGRCTI